MQVITTGGTIDKIYFDTLDGFEASDPQAPQIFKTADVGFQYNVLPLLKKDSLVLEEKDRALIKQKVESSPSDKILITHGTDTMDQTGKFLLDKSNEASVSNKTIVLVGAMQPAALSKTDAVFNLGFAACALLTLPPGVYITMNGQIFDPRNVVKNRSASRFEHSIPQHDTSDTGKS
ncbi:MAG: asparaginase domain-containing protein [Gammaproteobacteria bacterium]